MTNILSSISMHQAMAISNEAHEDAMVEQINNVFHASKKGQLTFQEFEHQLVIHPEMKEIFKALNVDLSESKRMFKLLDDDDDGLVGYDEFINGSIRLRGGAQALEFAMFVKEQRVANEWLAA